MDILEDLQENYGNGFVKSYRSTMHKGWYKKSEYFHLWHHLLYRANHKGCELMFNGENIKLNPGQFITGRKKLSEETGIHESKVERILNFFETKELQIEQQKTNKNRLISIVNWHLYQHTEQQVNNKRTTSEQQVNTNKNDKNIKEVIYYLNDVCNKSFKDSTAKTLKFINARINEGFNLDDFKKVIDIKSSQWLNTDNDKYLRPETLFGTKFEGYLNEKQIIDNTEQRPTKIYKQ